MSGIAGYFSPRRPFETLAPLAAMLRAIRHRGPDGAGLAAIDRRRGGRLEAGPESPESLLYEPCPHDLGLAQCRLGAPASGAGEGPPLWNEARSLVLVLQGEVHNRPELALELEKRGHRLRGASDVEAVLRAFEEWDVAAFARLNGPFAVALFDLRRGRLVLARDRIGESPLYVGEARGVLYFASEIPAILAAAGAGCFPVDEGAVHDFALHGSRDVECRTFYSGIRSLEPASTAVVSDDLAVRPVRGWRLPERRLEERELPLREACEVLRDLLADAVRIRLRGAHAPALELGDALDAAALAGLRASTEAARFPLFAASPAAADREARLIAARWPRHVEYRPLRLGPADFWEHADGLVRIAAEPLGSPRISPLRERRRRIRAEGYHALLVGAGADELLAGHAADLAEPFLASLMAGAPLAALARELAAASGAERLGLARRLVLGAPKPRAPHPALVALVCARGRPESPPPASFDAQLRAGLEHSRLGARLRSRDPLHLGVPIALRAPFLDYRVVELAFQLPTTYLIRRGRSKYVLRHALEPLLPLPIARQRGHAPAVFPWSEWLAASKAQILAVATDSSLGGVQGQGLAACYEALAAADPQCLWRLASLLLWHRRCNEGRPLAASAPAVGGR